MIEGTRVIHEARYPHPPERVWQALTDRAELAAWLMPNDFSPREGARFRFDARPAHAEPFECEVLEIEATSPNRLQNWRARLRHDREQTPVVGNALQRVSAAVGEAET
jgi:uncharacterized protein YndB with AHSA1/START domain